MEICTECQSVEQGFKWVEDSEGNELYPVCKACDSDDSRQFFDEDAGKD